jgi:hypothetical protein
VQKLSKNWGALHENHVLLVTTNSNERRAMLEILDEYQKLTTGTPKQRAFLGHSGENLVVVLDGDGGFASEDAATRFAIRYLKDGSYPSPSMVLIGGVCWGNPGMVKVGDVIVCGDIASANRSTARPDGSEVKFYPFKSSIELAELVEGIDPKPKRGDLISLEVRLSDEKARDALLEKRPSALGGEMEAFALVPECQSLPWLVVKAVSDFATVMEGREEQSDAAYRAAEVVAQLLERFQTTRRAELQEQTMAAATNLIHALKGKSIVIGHDQFHPDEDKFTAALQVMFSDQILVSTTIHTNAVAVHSNLAEDISSLLLEIVSNAFRHGRAKKAIIEFSLDGIVYSDDATEFDLNTLHDGQGRGGQAVYKKFRSRHTNSGSVEIKCQAGPKGNRIRLQVPHEIADLCNIVDQCSARFDRAALFQRRNALKWPATCQTVFVDVDALLMMSVVFDVCDEITASVNTGIKFVLRCSDPDRVSEIRGRYLDAVESGQICFVPAP